jgi:invasion protein IalB
MKRHTLFVVSLCIGFAGVVLGNRFQSTPANAQTEATPKPITKPKPVAKPKPKPAAAQKQDPNAKTDLANSPNAKVQKFGSWAVSCPEAGSATGARCFARLTVIDDKRKLVLINWLVGYNKEQKLLMDVLTPTEVDIAYGLNLKLDDAKPIKLSYISCGLQGCVSRTLIDDATFAKLKKAKTTTMTILSTDNKQIQMKIQPEGLAQAMAAISEVK